MPVYCYFIGFAYTLKQPKVFRRVIVKETAVMRKLEVRKDYFDCWPPNGNNQQVEIAGSYTDVPSLLAAYAAHMDGLIAAAEQVVATLKKKRARDIITPEFT